jgi:Zn-finger nucleic acid-binding protein
MADEKRINLVRVKCPTCKLSLIMKASLKVCPACRGLLPKLQKV